MDASFITDVKVALARIEERQVSSSKEITSLKESMTHQLSSLKTDFDHKLNGVKMAQSLFMPAKEIDQKLEAVKAHCDANRSALAGRVTDIEDGIRHYSRWFIGLCATAALGTAAMIWGIVSKAIHLGS